METVGTRWGELRVGLCGALTWTVPGLAGEVGCVRGQAFPCMEGAAGFSPKEKDPQGHFREFFCSHSSSLLPTRQPCAPTGMQGILSPNPKHGGRVHTTPRPQAPTGESTTQRDLRPQALGRVRIKEGPVRAHTHSLEEGECLNLWVQAAGELGWRLPEC